MEKITLRVFWAAMLLCASVVIVLIWLGESATPIVPQTAATLFVIGFASFLIWAPIVAYRFLKKRNAP